MRSAREIITEHASDISAANHIVVGYILDAEEELKNFVKKASDFDLLKQMWIIEEARLLRDVDKGKDKETQDLSQYNRCNLSKQEYFVRSWKLREDYLVRLFTIA